MSKLEKIASLTSIVLGTTTVCLAAALQLCSNGQNEIIYRLGLDSLGELSKNDYLVQRMALAAGGLLFMYAGKSTYKNSE